MSRARNERAYAKMMVEESLYVDMERSQVAIGNGRFKTFFILGNALPYKRDARNSVKLCCEIAQKKWNEYRHAAATNLFNVKFSGRYIDDNWYLTVTFTLERDIASDQDLHELKKLLCFFFLFEKNEEDEDQYQNIQEMLRHFEQLNFTINKYINIDEEGNLFLEDREDDEYDDEDENSDDTIPL